MSIGWHNPCPFEVGGGATLVEVIYDAMRGAVGVGGSAADDRNTAEGLWRQARASGIAACAAGSERAVINAFPGFATDLLPYYERLHGLAPAPTTTLVERRREAERAHTARVDATIGALTADLQRIDPRFAIFSPTREVGTETLPGRAFQDLAGSEPFGGGRQSTRFANYATGFVVHVLLDLDGEAPSLDDQHALDAARRLLNAVLPAHVHFQLATGHGFILDIDRLDITGLVP